MKEGEGDRKRQRGGGGRGSEGEGMFNVAGVTCVGVCMTEAEVCFCLSPPPQ